MPLLFVIGVTATNHSFSFYFCFMQRKTEAGYLRALNEMKSCFVNWIQEYIANVKDRLFVLMGSMSIALPDAVLLVCMCHIVKKIIGNLRSKFDSKDDWDDLFCPVSIQCRSATKMEYLKDGMLLHGKTSENVHGDLDDTWFNYKKKFTDAWANKIEHFGHTMTSRVKGEHATIKK